MGRPRILITETMIAEAERLGARGLTKEQIAYCLGFSADTLSRREKEFTGFAEAIKRGKSRGIAEVANALFESAIGGSIPGQIFFLKNRDPQNWKDRPDLHADDYETPTSIKVHMIDGRRKDENGNPIEYGSEPKEEAA